MAEDYREQWILHKGDSIQCAEDTYIISGDPIGFGGSSIIYPAVLEGKNNILEFALKECFPRKPERYMRKDGIVQPIDPTDEVSKAQLEAYHTMLEHEREVGQTIRNTSTRAVGIWKILKPISVNVNGKAYTETSGGFYSVLERMDKKGLFFNEVLEKVRSETPKEKMRKTYGLPPIHFTACLMEQTLRALDRIHQAGYLFGDIQGANVFFSECNTESGSAGIGHLIDFGSAQKLQADGYTEAAKSANVFSTDGFRPPELGERDDAFLQLGKQMDVYSAGCLMLRCVASPITVKMYGSSPCLSRNTLSEFDGEAIGCTPRVLQLVNAILEKSANSDASKRYKDAAEMLEAVLELKKASAPPAYLLPANLSSPDYFVPHSRDQELAILENDLKKEKTVYIWGLGGIGKTEVAIKLAERFTPRKAFLVHFKDSMKETVMQMAFSGYKFVPPRKNMPVEEVIEAEYQDRMRILREQYQDALIIVDNFNSEDKTLDDLRSEKEFRDLLGLNILRIFTTRYPCYQERWEIKELSSNALLKIMRFYITDKAVHDADLMQLIQDVNYHTLMTVLLARTLQKGRLRRITPEILHQEFRKGRLSSIAYPRVVSDQNRAYQQKQIYEHLKTLFDISKMSDSCKLIFRCAAFLSDNGMDIQLFEESLPGNDIDSLELLIDCGWIKITDQIIIVHPLIRTVAINECHPDVDLCRSFFSAALQYCTETTKTSSFSTFGDITRDFLQVITAYRSLNSCFNTDQLSVIAEEFDDSFEKLSEEQLETYLDCFSQNISQSIMPGNRDVLNFEAGKVFSLAECHGFQFFAYVVRDILEYPDHRLFSAVFPLKYQNTIENDIVIKNFHVPYLNPEGEVILIFSRHDGSNTVFLNRALLQENKLTIIKKTNILTPIRIPKRSEGTCVNAEYIADKTLGEFTNKFPKNYFVFDPDALDTPLDSEDKIKADHTYIELIFHSDAICEDDELIADYFYNGYSNYPINRSIAADLFIKVLREGGENKIINLAEIYRCGNDTFRKQDHEQAHYLFSLAASAGNQHAMIRIANDFIDGTGCTQDYAAALSWLEKAYHLGNTIAANNLGWMKLNGYGTAQDVQQAILLFQFAAESSNCPNKSSNRHLGKLYLGVHPSAPDFPAVDPGKALAYLIRAKELGATDVDVLIEHAEKMI